MQQSAGSFQRKNQRKTKMKKTTQKIALALTTLLLFHPALFAIDPQLNKEIISLEIEISRMKNRRGEYEEMSERELNKKIKKSEKELEEKRKLAQIESDKDKERFKEGAKKTGEGLKKAGNEIADTFKDIFN